MSSRDSYMMSSGYALGMGSFKSSPGDLAVKDRERERVLTTTI